MTIISNRIESDYKPYGFLVFRDSCLSGWGGARGGSSFIALAFHSESQAEDILAYAATRDEMTLDGRYEGVRHTEEGIGKWRPDMGGLGSHDHLSIQDERTARAWYRRPLEEA